jgi:hypothetical protein
MYVYRGRKVDTSSGGSPAETGKMVRGNEITYVYFDDFLLPHGIITAIPKLNLEYLYFVNVWSHFDIKEHNAFLLTQPDLKVLDLTNMVADDATMEAKMKNLQELSHCFATDVAIEKFTKLRQLTQN